MDGQDAHRYAAELHARIGNEPGWNFYGGDLPEWYRRALSAVTLLSGDEQPAYVSGRYDDNATPSGTLHLFFERSVVTIEARDGASDTDKETVIERPRAQLRALKVHVTEPPTNDLMRQDRWPGKVWVTAHYADDYAIELPVSSTNDTRMSEQLREFLPSLRADLGSRPPQA